MTRKQKIKNMVSAFKECLNRMNDQELYIAEIAYEKFLYQYTPVKPKRKKKVSEDVGWQA